MITNKDVRSLFGDLLDRIEDDALRDMVVDAWVVACEQGGWDSTAALADMPFTLLTDCHGIDFVQHTRSVTAGAIALAEALIANQPTLPYTVNMDWLVAGGLLHDVGKLLEIEHDGAGGFRKSHNGKCARHPISGAILAGKLGFPDEIINIIGCHAKEGEGRPQRVETVLVHQADFATFNPLVMINTGRLIT